MVLSFYILEAIELSMKLQEELQREILEEKGETMKEKLETQAGDREGSRELRGVEHSLSTTWRHLVTDWTVYKMLMREATKAQRTTTY